MMLPMAVAAGVRAGTIRYAFRLWEKPRVKVGSTQLTSSGIVGFDAVNEIEDLGSLTDDDARLAGVPGATELRRRLTPGQVQRGPRGGRGGDRAFRVTLRWVGEDPRLTLREDVPADLTELTAAVARLDRGRRTGPWTTEILVWIRDHPAVVSTELAALLGRELAPMKADVRRLKALGLTISLRVGYRLSPRGEAYLAALAAPPRRRSTRSSRSSHG
jgi:hypothetical protein